MKGKYIAVYAVIGFIVFFFSMEGWGADWKYYTIDGVGSSLFYDTQSVSRGQEITTVWIKMIFSDKAKVMATKKSPEIDGIENISHAIARMEINCSSNEQRTLSEVGYSSEGTVLYSSDVPDQFLVAPPDSIGARLVKIICK